MPQMQQFPLLTYKHLMKHFWKSESNRLQQFLSIFFSKNMSNVQVLSSDRE